VILSPCGKDDNFTTEVVDNMRKASPGMAGNQTIGSCITKQCRCTSVSNTGYWVRPYSRTSVLTIEATRTPKPPA
ncbi:hypothetical protein BaRGS_00028499, partial [Batillaria attramentaria]